MPHYQPPEYWQWTFCFLIGNDYFLPRAVIYVVHVDSRFILATVLGSMALVGYWVWQFRKRLFV